MTNDEQHQDRTFIALCSLGGIAAAWEIWTIVNKAIGDTFSAVLRGLGEGQPFIPFMFGMLNGHLWFSNKWTLAAVIVGFICGAIFWKLTDGQIKKDKD